MKYPIAVVPHKSKISIPSLWNLVRSLRSKAKGEKNQSTGRMSLLLPVRIDCSSEWESWLVQHRLAELGADWEVNFHRPGRSTPWNMRACLFLVVMFSVKEGHVRRPCVDWVTEEEFEAMQIPRVSGESLLLDYHHILAHRPAEATDTEASRGRYEPEQQDYSAGDVHSRARAKDQGQLLCLDRSGD